MDRHDVALRCYLAELTGSHANPAFDSDPKEWLYDAIASTAYKAADAFMDYAESIDARPVKSGPSAPVAPKSEAAKWVPQVGDVVKNAAYSIVFTGFRDDGGFNGWILSSTVGQAGRTGDWSDWQVKQFEYVRPATPSELAAAGLPSPEATRPTWVRWTVASIPGEARRLLRWVDGKPVVGRYNTRTGIDESKESGPIEPGGWVACDPPPAPVEPAKLGTVESMAAHLAWCAWCGTDGRSELPYDAFRAGYLAALAARGAP